MEQVAARVCCLGLMGTNCCIPISSNSLVGYGCVKACSWVPLSCHFEMSTHHLMDIHYCECHYAKQVFNCSTINCLESSIVHDEEEKVHSDKNNKRKLKTKAQLEALENFYNEHKYPLESLKLELAEKIGLTEKQVSGWFCHRRLKDKRISASEACANGRLDRSSGVIQDHGSAPGQDSCGSTKPRDYIHVDAKEVDSRMISIQNVPALDHSYHKRSRYEGDFSDMDATSSDRNSGLQDIFISQGVNSSDIKSSRYLTQNGSNVPVDDNIVKNRPSGYLKLKGKREHVAITTVKWQLGRHYIPDGPPLGIEFDPLPPCAFETQMPEMDDEPFRVEAPVTSYPPERSSVRKHHSIRTIRSRDSLMEHENIRNHHRPTSQENFSSRQPKHSSFIPKYYSNSMNGGEGSAGTNSMYNNNTNRNLATRSSHDDDVDTLILTSVYKNHKPLDDEKIVDEPRRIEPYLRNYDNVSSTSVQRREFFKSDPPSAAHWNKMSLEMTGDGSTRRIPKDGKLYAGRSGSREHHNSGQVKINPTNNTLVKFASCDLVLGSDGSMPSGSSGDETDETSGSME